MDLLQAVVLALIQGLTEFIPVSSSGHLVIIPYLFNWEQQSVTFDLVLHIGTLGALLFFYRKRLMGLITGIFSNDQKVRNDARKLALNLIITTIPAVIAALIFEDLITSTFSSINVVIISLTVIGILLIYLDNYQKKNTKKLTNLTQKSALTIGLLQSLALIRGVSRSGITMIGGILSGLDRKNAADYAFLAGITVISASMFKVVLDLTDATVSFDPLILITGLVVSFASGLFAINFLISYLQNYGLKIFGYYRIMLAAFILVLSLIK